MIQNALTVLLLSSLPKSASVLLGKDGGSFNEWFGHFWRVSGPLIARLIRDLLQKLQQLLLGRRKVDWVIVVCVLTALSTITDCLPIYAGLNSSIPRLTYYKSCWDALLGLYTAGYGGYRRIYQGEGSLGKVKDVQPEDTELELLLLLRLWLYQGGTY